MKNCHIITAVTVIPLNENPDGYPAVRSSFTCFCDFVLFHLFLLFQLFLSDISETLSTVTQYSCRFHGWQKAMKQQNMEFE